MYTTLAGDKHGHAGLIMKDTLYVTMTTIKSWKELKDPGLSSTIPEKVTVDH